MSKDILIYKQATNNKLRELYIPISNIAAVDFKVDIDANQQEVTITLVNGKEKNIVFNNLQEYLQARKYISNRVSPNYKEYLI